MKRLNSVKLLKLFIAIITLAVLGLGEQVVLAKSEEATKEATVSSEPYLHSSSALGYSILCPTKPVGVIPASEFYDGRTGEILIFDNEGYDIKNAWVIITDAFTDEAIPDLNSLDEEAATKLLADIMTNNGYEGIMLVERNIGNKAIYAVTAKEIEVDEDGDGTIDFVATSDTQMAVMFFRGDKGGRFSVQLVDNPELREEAIKYFRIGASSLKEL